MVNNVVRTIMDYTQTEVTIDELIADLTHIKSRMGNIRVASYHGKKPCTKLNVKVTYPGVYYEDDYKGEPTVERSCTFSPVCVIGYEVDE